VFSTPLLRAVNLSIAVLLIALLAAAYWFMWRPLPETSGQIAAPVTAGATIARDALGVPHITAASWEDAIFLQGYVTAQDRLWQMDAMRRLAAGELAEVLGKSAIARDEDSRRLRTGRIAEEQERTMAPGDRALLAAYARGVNFFLSTHRGRLPAEFKLLNYDPRPWKVRDSILVGLEMYRALTTSWRAELVKYHMIERGDRAKVEFLFPPRTGAEPQPGSNAWVISGARSASGKPILANDPHLEYSIPSPWYLVHLRAPGLDVTGAAIVGLPAVIAGHNQRIAWGLTNLEFDVQDLYQERFDQQTGRYQFQEQTQQARLEQDVLAVKGEQPHPIALWVTRHGPIVITDEGQPYALRWTGAEPGGFTDPFLDINRAQNWGEFTTAIARFGGPAQNFLYADTDGNIGYHVSGRLPVRKNCAGDVPADGARGDCEWDGFMPFDQLPQSFNPASGVIVSANQNPFPSETASQINGNFAPPYRALQIQALLGSRAKWKAEDMIAIQKDVYSAFMHFLAGQLAAAWDKQKPNHPELADAAGILRSWNGQMEKGLAAPMVATLAYEQLRRIVAERAAAGLGETYGSQMAPAVLEKLLRERPADWFPDYDQVLVRCLTGAVQDGQKVQGSKVSRWDFGQYQALRIPHPVGSQLPLIGKYFNLGPVPMSGSPTSVKQYTRRLGPSLRMTFDLSDLEHSFASLTAGESGQWLSPHYKDQWDAYYNGRNLPMPFEKVDAKQVLVVKPE
jgi:penicillin G amidase